MKQIFIFALSFFLVPQVAFAESPLPAMIAPLAQKSLLLDITKTESRFIVVGERGHILTSPDAINWQQASVPVQSTLTSVFFYSPLLGWAVGHDSTILHSKDGGLTWDIQQYLPEAEKPLLDVLFFDENLGVAIGAYGQFYRTVDGGKNWVFEFHQEFLIQDDIDYLQELKDEDEEAYLDERASILPHFNQLFKDGRTLYLVGEIGLIAKSNDLGKHWTKFDEIYQGSFLDIVRTEQGNLLLAGLRGHIFRSIKNGSSWQSIDSKTTALLNSIVLGDNQQIFVLGNNGVLLQSKDDGQTFISRPQHDGKSLIAGVWFEGKIIAVSDVGIKTINITTPGIFK